MRYRFSLLAFIIALALGGPFFASGVKPSAQNSRPGRKYSTIERLQPERLRAVRDDRLRHQNSRHPVSLETGFRDFRAVLHAHAEDSTHTGGTLPELLRAAERTSVKIVMLTEHVRPPRDFINDSWRGPKNGVLFIPGAEAEGFLVFPSRSIIEAHVNKSFKRRDDYVKLVKNAGGLILLSHVEDKDNWITSALDGLEIYNHHTDIEDEPEFTTWLRGSFTDPDRLKRLEQALAEFPMEVFGSGQDYLEQIIAKWDRDLLRHRLTGIAANDCHHNYVFTIKAALPDAIQINGVGDQPRKITTEQAPRIAELLKDKKDGEQIAKLDFDPYERSLSYVTTHILLQRNLSEASVKEALRQSHAYVAHDWLCDPTGFAFTAESGGKRVGVMGDELNLAKGMKLRLEAPAAGLIKLFIDGRMVHQVESDRLSFAIDEPAVYRAEVWLEVGGEMRPWIYANPIRVLR